MQSTYINPLAPGVSHARHPERKKKKKKSQASRRCDAKSELALSFCHQWQAAGRLVLKQPRNSYFRLENVSALVGMLLGISKTAFNITLNSFLFILKHPPDDHFVVTCIFLASTHYPSNDPAIWSNNLLKTLLKLNSDIYKWYYLYLLELQNADK